MKTNNVPVTLIGVFVFLCLMLVVGLRGGPVVGAEPRTAEKDLLKSKDEMVAAYKKSIARVVSVLADKKIRESDRPTTVAAIKLAGTLRAKEAVPYLVNLLLYGTERNISDAREKFRLPPRPHTRAPAVQALINIGMPSLEAVRKKLVSVSTSKRTRSTDTLYLHCVWVIWKVLGTDLGKEYILICQRKYPEEKKAFDGAMRFFEIHEKVEGNAAVKGKS